MTTREFHPVCLMLPAMMAAEYMALRDSIRAEGLLRPITTCDGLILDGRHRFNACLEVGVEPRFEAYTGPNPAEHVRALHTQRNLSAAQKTLLSAAFMEFEQGAARERQAHGHTAPGRRLVANLPPALDGAGKARDKAGERFGVSGRNVQKGVYIKEHAVPEVIAKAGVLSVNQAEQIAKLPPEQQRAIVALPTKAARASAIKKAAPKPPARDGKPPADTKDDIIQNLRAELGTMAETIRGLSDQLDTYKVAAKGDPTMIKEMGILKESLRLANLARDTGVQTIDQLRGEVKMLRRQNKVAA